MRVREQRRKDKNRRMPHRLQLPEQRQRGRREWHTMFLLTFHPWRGNGPNVRDEIKFLPLGLAGFARPGRGENLQRQT